MGSDYAAAITEFPLFRGYTNDGAQMLIDSGAIRELAPGEILLMEGDPAGSVLLVLAGKLEVFVEREGAILTLTESGPGTIIGELAVLCGIPRSASVRTIEDSAILEIGATDFRSLLLRNSFLSERIFRQSLKTLIEKERALISELTKSGQA